MEQARKDIDRLKDQVDRLRYIAIGAICVSVISTVGFVVAITSATSGKYTNAKAVAGCERNKADRIDAARGATAQADYLGLVLRAASVQGDVKAAATAARAQWAASAAGLRSRIYECRPLVEHDRKVPDREALGLAAGAF